MNADELIEAEWKKDNAHLRSMLSACSDACRELGGQLGSSCDGELSQEDFRLLATAVAAGNVALAVGIDKVLGKEVKMSEFMKDIVRIGHITLRLVASGKDILKEIRTGRDEANSQS